MGRTGQEGTEMRVGVFIRVMACALAASACVRASGDTESTPLGVPEGPPLIDSSRASANRSESLPIGDAAGGASDPFAFSEYLETLLALGAVLGLAVGGSVAFKKFARGRGGLAGAMGAGGASPSGVLEVLGRYPIGAGQSLVLLRFDTRVLLLHQVGGRKNPSMRTISEVSGADEVASIMMKTRDAASDAADSSFRETIRKMERGFGEPAIKAQPAKPAESMPARSTDPAQQQIDMLVGEGERPFDVRAIRGRLRGWMGAGS